MNGEDDEWPYLKRHALQDRHRLPTPLVVLSYELVELVYPLLVLHSLHQTRLLCV